MLNKLNQLSVAAYVKTSAFFRGLKSDERGLSGVVVAVLLILVAVLAVVMLWGLLKGYITDLWGIITGKSSGLN